VGRLVAAALLVCAAVLSAAAPAAADPADLVPYCSGDQTPMDSNCRATPSQIFTHTDSGISPDLAYGLNPGEVPAL
jgi:hypothetical protein